MTLAEAYISMVWHRGLLVFMSNNVFINLCDVYVNVALTVSDAGN